MDINAEHVNHCSFTIIHNHPQSFTSVLVLGTAVKVIKKWSAQLQYKQPATERYTRLTVKFYCVSKKFSDVLLIQFLSVTVGVRSYPN